MYEADRLAVECGVSSLSLMENAGRSIAEEIQRNWTRCPVLILCGPGNNGGDGYVIARYLLEASWPVRIATFGDTSDLSGDASVMFGQYAVDVVSLDELGDVDEELVVDALFGAGFKGDLPPEARAAFQKISLAGLDLVAVDVPSGVCGLTGDVVEGTPIANLTVSFQCAKVGHLFYPARAHIGILKITDIGIPDQALDLQNVSLFQNTPELWLESLATLSPIGHKYDRGHAAVVGGGISSSGAARIAARAALRASAGAVTVVCKPSALTTYAVSLEAVMVESISDETAFESWIAARRIGTVLLGPGNGVGERTRTFVRTAINSEAHVVLDADALTEFQDDPEVLFRFIREKTVGSVVLTPHEAEFSRLFTIEGTALVRCREAAKRSGAVVILKGATTVIAEPTGNAALNTNAPPWLATAGSGDALAGIVAALLTKGEDAFKSASAAVWMHGEAANIFGRGLIAEDIEVQIPKILEKLANL